MNVAVLLSVLTSARSRGSHADVAERKSHSATMHTNTMMSAFVVRMFTVESSRCARARASELPAPVWGGNEPTVLAQANRMRDDHLK